MNQPDINTQRFLGGDIIELRDRYLGDMAHLMNASPREVDRMRVRDFARLALWVDAYYKTRTDSSGFGIEE